MTDAASATPAGTTSPSLYEQLGGEPAVTAVVDVFYDRVLADPELQQFFTGVDLGRLKGHQRRFVAQALGAGRPYSGRSMRKAHENLSITGDAYGRVMGHLAAALAEAGVDQATIDIVAGALAPLRGDIVTA